MIRLANRALRRPLRAALALGVAPLAWLPSGTHAQAVVQALPDPAVGRLNDALRRLSQDPQSTAALIDAGQASLALDNIDAALGFFQRAQAVAPVDGRVSAGLAAVMVRQGYPLEALRLFGEAERAGEPMRVHAADRGLAYDLIGANALAQEEYHASLSFAPDPAVTRRLALSQAIAGNAQASETTLLPLLQRNDLAAYRARAFALAIVGRPDEAVAIAETMLPGSLSGRMAPYLRYMPRLTRAQQAAAANLGAFPRAADIGRDDPAVVAYAAQLRVQSPSPSPPLARGPDSRLAPSGQPLGPQREGGIPRREELAAPPPTPTPIAVADPPVVQPPPAEPAAQVVQAVVQEVDSVAPPPVVVAALPPEESEARPSISLDASAAPPPPPRPNLAQAFSDFSLPAGPVVPAVGAVDISTIEPARERPPPPPPPPKPVVPSRHWVQVATGRDTGALAFDWRRIKREAAGLLDKTNPHTAKWGQTNRLVAGPFASAREANEMVTKLKEKGVDSFRFTSAQGEDVERLD